MSLDTRLRRQLDALDAQGLRRSLPRISHRDGVQYRLGDRDVIGFCSNDYLGLADRILPHKAPAGAASSRLICGDQPLHREVERRLALLTGTPDAVLFPSGFQLNVGVLPSILSSEDTVYSDRLNHASLIDGLRLAHPRPTILPHGDAPPASTADGLTWWVTESIFSMDGDAADADALRRAIEAGTCVYLDDAHGLGLYAGGRGWASAHELRPTLYVGTLSKAFGCAGAFVAGSETACRWIRTRARSFVFSTGMSPRVVASIDAALDLVTGDVGDHARTNLRENLRHLGEGLGFSSPPPSPIVPLVLGDNARAVSVAEQLLARGWHVQAIRPPTVPEGTARLRITVSAGHEPEHIRGLVSALRDILGTTASSTLSRPGSRP
ncbi:MAG: aminotransferase class I/II-fold pyridoxal phosphate-dependent enzyme [Myxococcota bacterium]